MSLVNLLSRLEDRVLMSEGVSILLRLLSPIAPHVTHFLWQELGFGEDILTAPWPEVDENALVQESMTYVVQVNGKVRAKIEVPSAADKAEIESLAQANENVQRFLEGLAVRKIIVVPKKLVNIVAG
jgi:leucyl-tRNA synthetase